MEDDLITKQSKEQLDKILVMKNRQPKWSDSIVFFFI